MTMEHGDPSAEAELRRLGLCFSAVERDGIVTLHLSLECPGSDPKLSRVAIGAAGPTYREACARLSRALDEILFPSGRS